MDLPPRELTLNTEIGPDNARRIRWYLTFVESFISFIDASDTESPIVRLLVVDGEAGVGAVRVQAHSQQLQMPIHAFAFNPRNLQMKRSLRFSLVRANWNAPLLTFSGMNSYGFILQEPNPTVEIRIAPHLGRHILNSFLVEVWSKTGKP